MVLFAVPNVFLYLPGSSVLTGMPLMILALQLIVGRQSVWLPWVERIERLARPRLWPGGTAAIDRLIGVAYLVMALLRFLPFPFANGVPALAIAALGLALSERDGFWLATGLLGSAFAVVFVAAIVGGGVVALARII